MNKYLINQQNYIQQLAMSNKRMYVDSNTFEVNDHLPLMKNREIKQNNIKNYIALKSQSKAEEMSEWQTLNMQMKA